MKEQIEKLVERYQQEKQMAERFIRWNQRGQSRIGKELRIRNEERIIAYGKVIGDLTLIMT